ncbi:MAG: metalloregulator ArsR/SmtB family transcription factor [Desulfobacula sp.]|jgi:ubiquinone/menaquinone biosynthesis C-methylase UbiE|nr:metalloregulator ArsR/SmtB family transcription factor [Desulfobacula sp.]
MELIKCFKALSDNTRLRLLQVLQQYELNVNEIVLVVDMIQSGVSRHLKILLDSGLLTSRRDGSFTYYFAAKNDTTISLIRLLEKNLDHKEITSRDLEKSREMIKIRQNRTKRFFKYIAPQWDRLKKEVFGNFDLNSMIKGKVIFKGKIADLGCGTGELIDQFSKEIINNFIGIDSSPEMLEQARLRLSGTNNAELRLGELEHLPMKNKEIDTAIMNMVLHHISQPQLPIAEAYRVLKPKGFFILSDFQKHDQKNINEIMGGSWYGFEKEKIMAWLADAGFHVRAMDSYPVNHGLKINVFTAQK